MNSSFEVSNLTFSYGRRKAPVFSNFSLAFHPGRIYGLLGKNGTGKSTLLYLMCGLLRPQAGACTIDGTDMKLRRAELLQEIFLVPEEIELPNIKLAEYVKIQKPFYPRFSEQQLNAGLAELGMTPDVKLGELSMGQKKKVFIAFALAANTRFLIMDEPTNGLDIPSKSQFRKVVATQMTDERTIIISTHQVRDIDMLLDHITLIDAGQVLVDSSVADICSRLAFEERTASAEAADVLFSQPSMNGNAVITRNADGRETTLNLELLFNAVLERPEIVDLLKG